MESVVWFDCARQILDFGAEAKYWAIVKMMRLAKQCQKSHGHESRLIASLISAEHQIDPFFTVAVENDENLGKAMRNVSPAGVVGIFRSFCRIVYPNSNLKSHIIV